MELNESGYKNDWKTTTSDIWEYVRLRYGGLDRDIVQQDAASGEVMSFNKLSNNVESLASVLRKLDLPSGIGICSENNIDYCWILLGALSAGVRCTLLSPTYMAREMQHFLNLTKPDIVLCSKLISNKIYENGESLDALCAKYSFIKNLYVWGLTDEDFTHASLSSLLSNDTKSPFKGNLKLPQDQNFEGTREALILASSGSTGIPKGVILTHQAVVETLKLSFVFARSGETALGLMPFCHAYGLFLSLMCLCEGSKLIIVPKFIGAKYLSDVIDSFKINNLYLIPSLLATIGKSPSFTREKMSCVRHILTAASKISRVVEERVLEIMPEHAVLHSGYGMTETSFIILTGVYKKPECSGKLLPQMECKIMRDGKVCSINETGELWLRGPTVMKGYLNNEKETAESLQSDGWLKSGDLGYRDQDGDFFIVGRIKEMIKYQANQVSPVEIEGIILELPDVLEAAVVGLPSEEFGELPAAVIILKENSKLTAEEIKSHVAKQLSPYKRLRGGVFFIEELPKTGSGKIQRKKLRTQIIDIIKRSST